MESGRKARLRRRQEAVATEPDAACSACSHRVLATGAVLHVLDVDAESGANLRNRLAHGMMETGEFQSVPGIYLWWLLLRMTLMSSSAMRSWVPEKPDDARD